MTEINMNEVNSALQDLRSEFDKKSQDLGKIEKINTILDAHEVKNQELVSSIKSAESKNEELEKKLGELEAKASSPMLHSGDDEKEAAKFELKAYENYFSKGDKALSDEMNVKYLRTDVNSDGGYLVPVEESSEIIKNVTEISDVRSLARVRTLNAKTLRLPVRSGLLTGGWAGEGETGLDSCSTYGREELVAKKLTVSCAITIEELQDATPNMVSEINSDVAEGFRQLEGNAFVLGDGVQKPEGLLASTTNITQVNASGSSTFTFDDLIKLTGELKVGYNPTYAFNRQTLAFIRTLKDGASAYIWRAGNLGAGVPNAINGVSYAVLQDMPTIATNALPVIYGDFSRGYLIGDRAGMSVVRDETTLKKQGKVEFTFMKRLDGAVIQPEAFKILKTVA